MFTRAKPTNWSTNDTLTSAQINLLDIDHANALDKTGDTIDGGSIEINAGGEIILNTAAAIQAEAAGAIEGNIAAAIRATAAGAITSTVAGGIRPGVAGGIKAQLAGGIQSDIAAGIKSAVVGGIQLAGGATDWETFSATRSRIIRIAPYRAIQLGGSTFTLLVGTGGVQANGNGGVLVFDLSEYLHDGATLSTVTASISVGAGWSTLPTDYPKIHAKRYDPATQTQVDLSSSGAATFTPTPANTTAWTAAGVTQTWALTCNQNNVIDRSLYQYFVTLDDSDGGTGSTNIYFLDLKLTFTGIADMRFA